MKSESTNKQPIITWKATVSNNFNPFDSFAEEVLVSWTIDDPVIIVASQKEGISLSQRIPNHVLSHLEPTMNYVEAARVILEVRTRSNPFMKYSDLQRLVRFFERIEQGDDSFNNETARLGIPEILSSSAIFDTAPTIPYLAMEYRYEEFWGDLGRALSGIRSLTNEEVASSILHLFSVMLSSKGVDETIELGRTSYATKSRIKYWKKHNESEITNTQICHMILDEIVKQAADPTGFSTDFKHISEMLFQEIISTYNGWAMKAFSLEALINCGECLEDPLPLEFHNYSLWKIVGSLYYNQSLDKYLPHLAYLLEYLGQSDHYRRLMSLRKIFGKNTSLMSLASSILYSEQRTDLDDAVLREMNVSSHKDIVLHPEFLEALDISRYDSDRMIINEKTMKKIPALIAYLCEKEKTIQCLQEDQKHLSDENSLLKEQASATQRELAKVNQAVSRADEESEMRKEFINLKQELEDLRETYSQLLDERNQLAELIRSYEEDFLSRDSIEFDPFEFPLRVNYFGFEEKLAHHLAKYNVVLKILDPTKPLKSLPKADYTFINVSRASHTTWYSLKSHGISPLILASRNVSLLEQFIMASIYRERINSESNFKKDDEDDVNEGD